MVIVDASHALHRTIAMNKDKIASQPEFVAHLFINQILSFSSKLGGSKQNKVVVCFDSSSWRKKYYIDNKPKSYGNETYKGNRVKDDSIDWKSVYDLITKVEIALKEYSDFTIMRVAEAEADDIIAVLAKTYKHQETIWIASSDKDFIQLQDTPIVNIYDPLKQQFKPSVDKDFYKKIHIMIGDTSDNIKAIKERLGEKTAVKMLKELDILLQTSPSMRERYEFNKNLIDFDCIPSYITNNILEQYQTPQGSYNAIELMKNFQKLNLAQHSENINKFKLSEAIINTKLNTYFKKVNSDIDMSRSNLMDFFS